MILLDNTPLLTREVLIDHGVSMLTGVKVSSLWKCVFCRPKLTGKYGFHGTEIFSFWNAKIK